MVIIKKLYYDARPTKYQDETFVMSPAYFGTSGILSRNLIQLNVPKVCIHGYIYTTYISKYVQIKVKRKIWNLCLKTLHVFFNSLLLKLFLIPKSINLNKFMQYISCKFPVICVTSIQWWAYCLVQCTVFISWWLMGALCSNIRKNGEMFETRCKRSATEVLKSCRV